MTNDEYRHLIEFLGQRFEAIDQRFEGIDQRFEAVERRMDRGFLAVDQRFAALESRVDGLQQSIDERFREVFGHFDALYRRIERLEAEYQAVLQALRRIEALLVDEQGRRELLEHGLEVLKRQVAELQARIEHLEGRLRES